MRYVYQMEAKEIEVRFLEIDKNDLVTKLKALGAKDLGEALLEEIIFYDPELKMLADRQFVRLRRSEGKTVLTYKHHRERTVDGAIEIEFEVSDIEKAEAFLEKLGFPAYRHQEKKRHTLMLDDVAADIDTWPSIPAYVEFEGPSEEALKAFAAKAGFDWKNAVFDDARAIIEGRYHVPVGTMRWFTFDKCE
jgi:adenylate cyclase, class 2